MRLTWYGQDGGEGVERDERIRISWGHWSHLRDGDTAAESGNVMSWALGTLSVLMLQKIQMAPTEANLGITMT